MFLSFFFPPSHLVWIGLLECTDSSILSQPTPTENCTIDGCYSSLSSSELTPMVTFMSMTKTKFVSPLVLIYCSILLIP